MSYLLLTLGLLLVLLAWSAVRPSNGSRPIWVTALVGSELAGPLAIGAAVITAGVVFRAWAGGWPGVIAGWTSGVAAVAFGLAFVRGLLTRPLFADAVTAFTGAPTRIPFPAGALIAPVASRRGVTITSHRYGPDDRHVLDLEIAGAVDGPRPVLVHVHGGGWWRGRRHTQARPLRRLLTRSGWAVVAPSYRLSPDVKFPEHLIDVKRAIAWVRDNAGALGVDPGFIAISGGSTGANIAALAALTTGDARYQPGFEDADVGVQVCAPLYGVHDLLRSPDEPLWPYLVDTVMGVSPADDPDAWRRASPARVATAARPPFFVLHGASDTLVRPELSRRLVAALEDSGGPAVGYLEIPWANHGFDFFAGPRGRYAAHAVLTVLQHAHAKDRAEQ